MGHDIHFLERLSRVRAPQAELALRLYRDVELLKGLLAEHAPGAERAAVALEHGRRTPYLIVASSGRVVTCLGSGMIPYGVTVISRAQLDRARARHAAQAFAEERGGYSALQEQAWQTGHRLERESVEAVVALCRLTPARDRLGGFFSLVEPVNEIRPLATRSPQLKDGLQTLWTVEHALSMEWLMVANASRSEIAQLNETLRDDRWAPLACVELAKSMRASMMIRAGWGVGQLGKPFLAAFAELARRASTWPELLASAFGLAALGLAHPHLQPHALEALRAGLGSGADWSACSPEVARLGPALVDAVASLFADPIEATGRALAFGQAACVRLGRRLAPGAEFRFERPEDVPPELALGVACNLPEGRLADAASVRAALDLLPWALARKAPALFLPREATALLPTWEPAFTNDALAALRRCTARPAARAATSPGRNDPCTCGSGQKFKRCCAAQPGPAIAA